jgi:type I restriction enzyme R subunit
LEEALALCQARGIQPQAILTARDIALLKHLDDAVEALLADQETKRRFLALACLAEKLYKATLPDPAASALSPQVRLLVQFARMIHALEPEPAGDMSAVTERVGRLLDGSITMPGYVIREVGAGYDARPPVDLSQLDLQAAQTTFTLAHPHTAAEQLRGALATRLRGMLQRNRRRRDFANKLQRLIDEYNAGSLNVELFFHHLVELAGALDAEEQRLVAERLTEEELALFDLLTRPAPPLSESEREQIKKMARELLATLKREKLVLDWRKKQQTRAAVRAAIGAALDGGLPGAYPPDLYDAKCQEVYQHIYESYADAAHSLYAAAS